MAKVGRPTDYTLELEDRICEEIALGSSLRTVCAAEDMPNAATVFRWLRQNEEFSKHYARACEERSEAMIEDTFDIADDGRNDWMTVQGKKVTNREAIERSKLRVDVRKWYASKMKPKKYGDKVDLTTNGKDLPTPIYGGLSVKPISDTTNDVNTEV